MRVPDNNWVQETTKKVVRTFRGHNLPPLVQKLSPNHSYRGHTVDLVVIHDTEGGYEGAVSWLCNPKAGASAHIILREDGDEATQIVPLARAAWSCVAYNHRSVNLELAGKASLPYPYPQLDSAARIVAYLLTKYKLQPKHTGPHGGGFAYHSDLGIAGGGHHDPGFSIAQRRYFEERVALEFKRGGFRKVYAR